MNCLQSTYSGPVKKFTLFSSDIYVTILLFLHAFPTSDPDIKLVFSKQKHLCMVYLDHLLKQRKIAAVITVKYNLPTNLIIKNAIESVQSKVQNNAIS